MIKKYIISGALFTSLIFSNFGVALADHAVEKSQPSFLAGLWSNFKSRVKPLFNIFYFPTDPQPPALKSPTPVKFGVGREPSPRPLYIPGQFGFGGTGGIIPSASFGGPIDSIGSSGGFRGGGFLEFLPSGGVSGPEQGNGEFGFLESLPGGGVSDLEGEEGEKKNGAPSPPPKPAPIVPPKLVPTAPLTPTTAKPMPSLVPTKPAAPLPPTTRTPQAKAIHLGVGSKNNTLAYVKEGDIIQFTAMVGFADRTSKDVTSDVRWAVLGDIGSITPINLDDSKNGVFTAKLGASVSEYGQGAGSVTATYSGPEGVLFGKSSVFTVYAGTEAETEGDIGGQ